MLYLMFLRLNYLLLWKILKNSHIIYRMTLFKPNQADIEHYDLKVRDNDFSIWNYINSSLNLSLPLRECPH